MYKRASRSRSTQTHVRQSPQARLAHFIVVAFRQGRDNKGRETVYRRVWTSPFRDEALRIAKNEIADSYLYCAVYEAHADLYECIYSRGASDMVSAWIAQRKGVNRNADWLTSGAYADREYAHEDVQAISEANKYTSVAHNLGYKGKAMGMKP